MKLRFIAFIPYLLFKRLPHQTHDVWNIFQLFQKHLGIAIAPPAKAFDVFAELARIIHFREIDVQAEPEPQYYTENLEERETLLNQLDLFVYKNLFEDTGDVRLHFDTHVMRIMDEDEDDEYPESY